MVSLIEMVVFTWYLLLKYIYVHDAEMAICYAVSFTKSSLFSWYPVTEMAIFTWYLPSAIGIWDWFRGHHSSCDYIIHYLPFLCAG